MRIDTYGILGTKIGQTSLFAPDGRRVNVTVVQAGPCKVVQKKSKEKDGYEAVQIGFGKKDPYHTNKPDLGRFKKAGLEPLLTLREIRLPSGELAKLEVGHDVTIEPFKTGELVDVIGTTKGKGFQGVVRRHGFSGFRASHGTHEYFRHSGGISAREQPGKVWKQKRMPGRMGGERCTMQNLRLLDVRTGDNLLLIEGAVPGAINSVVYVQKARKSAIRAKH